ncbi:MAG: STAS/SEC14 domain-containing protein [Rickettsiales bacterium]
MACEYKEVPELKTVEIMVDGKVTVEDFDKIAPQLEKFIETHGTIKILEIIKNFGGFDIALLGKGMVFDMKHMKNFSHCAVVAEEGWIGPFTRMLSPFFNVEIKTFLLEEADKARNWLKTS